MNWYTITVYVGLGVVSLASRVRWLLPGARARLQPCLPVTAPEGVRRAHLSPAIVAGSDLLRR